MLLLSSIRVGSIGWCKISTSFSSWDPWNLNSRWRRFLLDVVVIAHASSSCLPAKTNLCWSWSLSHSVVFTDSTVPKSSTQSVSLLIRAFTKICNLAVIQLQVAEGKGRPNTINCVLFWFWNHTQQCSGINLGGAPGFYAVLRTDHVSCVESLCSGLLSSLKPKTTNSRPFHRMKSHYVVICGSPLHLRHVKETSRKSMITYALVSIFTLTQPLISNTHLHLSVLCFQS